MPIGGLQQPALMGQGNPSWMDDAMQWLRDRANNLYTQATTSTPAQWKDAAVRGVVAPALGFLSADPGINALPQAAQQQIPGTSDWIQKQAQNARMIGSKRQPELEAALGVTLPFAKVPETPALNAGLQRGAELFGLQDTFPGARIVAGRGAAYADPAVVNQASDRLKAGESPAQVLQETGWFRGPDGMMRTEIADNEAAYRPGAAGYDISMAPPPGVKRYFTVGQVLDHPDLYANYPGIENMRLEVWNPADLGPGVGGHFDKSWPKIAINSNLFPMLQDGKSILLHELDHAIQAKEGFAKGANPTDIKTRLDNMKAAEIWPLQTANRKWNEAWDSSALADRALTYNQYRDYAQRDSVQPRLLRRSSFFDGFEVARMFGRMPSRPGPARTAWTQNVAGYLANKVLDSSRFDRFEILRQAQDPAEARRMIARAATRTKNLNPAARMFSDITRKYADAGNMSAYDNYLREGGEAQARATQNRMWLTPGERRSMPMTYDAFGTPLAESELIGLGELPANQVMDKINPRYLK